MTYALVGGGPGAFIGDVHRKAVAMDGKARLVAGCFSQAFENTLATGEAWGVDKSRLYRTAAEMIAVETVRPDRLDFIVITVPNTAHYPIAKAALEAGFPVVCEKPLAASSREAEELHCLAAETGLPFMVTYAYRGYPLVYHMRDMIAAGELGDIRFVSAEYPQDWLATLLEKTGQKQAAWRTDPAKAGISNCVGDIGSHIENMVAYLTGLDIERLLARTTTPRSWSNTRAGPRACTGAPRSPRATTTALGSGSSVQKPRSSGPRKTPTTPRSATWTSPPPASRAAATP
jgi:predicted dehydrogenase